MAEKILINILSEEMIPNFIAAMELQPDRIIALASKEYRWQIKVLEKYTAAHRTVEYKPFDFQGDFNVVAHLTEELPKDAEIFINFTGGTKIMSLSAVLGGMFGGKNRLLTLVYADTLSSKLQQIGFREGKMEMLDALPMSVPIPIQAHIEFAREKIKSVENTLSAQQKSWLEQIGSLMWKPEMRGFFSKQKELHGERGIKGSGNFSFQFKHPKKGVFKGDCEWQGDRISITPPKGETVQLEGEGVVEFLAGNWLEAFVFDLCEKSGQFDMLQLNTTLSLREETLAELQRKRRKVKGDKNELDVVVSKGVRSAIIECKAGRVTQDAIYKVAALRDHLFGSYGVAAVACCFKPDPGILEKARDYGVYVFYGLELVKKLPLKLSGILVGE